MRPVLPALAAQLNLQDAITTLTTAPPSDATSSIQMMIYLRDLTDSVLCCAGFHSELVLSLVAVAAPSFDATPSISPETTFKFELAP
jgi:hypothetical protein